MGMVIVNRVKLQFKSSLVEVGDLKLIYFKLGLRQGGLNKVLLS